MTSRARASVRFLVQKRSCSEFISQLPGMVVASVAVAMHTNNPGLNLEFPPYSTFHHAVDESTLHRWTAEALTVVLSVYVDK